MRLAIFALGAVLSTYAQTASRTVVLTWEDTLNPTTATYSVYRAPGPCSGIPTFAKLATAQTTKTYSDTTAVTGLYCYAVTATDAGVESAPSNMALAVISSASPTRLQIQVQVQ